MKQIILFFTTLFILQSGAAQTDSLFSSKLSDWVEHPLPLANGIFNPRINKNGCPSTPSLSYQVYERDGAVKVQSANGKFGLHAVQRDSIPFSKEKLGAAITSWFHKDEDYCVKKVSNGYLVGSDSGEFGGNLWWYSEDGETSYRFGGATSYFFELGSRLWAFNHFSPADQGSIFNIVQNSKGKWVTGKQILLPGLPKCFTIYDNQMYIAAGDELIKFKPNEAEVSCILKCPISWRNLNPNTILFHENSIYISMQYGVLEISNVVDFAKNLKGNGTFDSNARWEMRWYEPH